MAVQAAPGAVGIALANWNWKVVRRFVEARCGVRLCRSACTRYLHRLGFAYKHTRPGLSIHIWAKSLANPPPCGKYDCGKLGQ